MSIRDWPPRTPADDAENDRACRAVVWICRALLAAILLLPLAGVGVVLWQLR